MGPPLPQREDHRVARPRRHVARYWSIASGTNRSAENVDSGQPCVFQYEPDSAAILAE